jgi:hypothetical protein
VKKNGLAALLGANCGQPMWAKQGRNGAAICDNPDHANNRQRSEIMWP